MRNILTEPIYLLKEQGFFDEFSTRHFLINVLAGNCDMFSKYGEKFAESSQPYISDNDSLNAMNFLMNFSKMIKSFENIISKKDLKGFFDDQLSAGKDNYDEDQFFRALSEMHILKYINTFHKVEKIQYEPKQGENGSNPEFKIVMANGLTCDIEVKTPGFQNKKYKGTVLKPNLILSEKAREKIKFYCKQNSLEFEYPRVLKLKDFINSAGQKFLASKNENHLSILMINWTYNDFYECNIKEPVTALVNPVSGIFSNHEAAENIGIDLNALSKIDAIVVYRDNINTMIFSDFRNNFENHTFKCIVNPIHMDKKDKIFDVLTMKPDNQFYVDWYPADYKNMSSLSREMLNRHSTYVLDCLNEDIDSYAFIDKVKVRSIMKDIEFI